MQHRYLTQACTRVVAGMFIGVLMAAANGAFADEASSFNQNVSFAPSSQANSQSLPSAQAAVQNAPSTPSTSSGTQSAPAEGGARAFLSGMAGKAGDVVVGALNMIGVRYRWGGNTPDSGLDCSGFVRYVFQDTLGMNLPRRAEEMSRVGEKVSMSNLKPGDLVFFNTMRRTFSHVGIYIGDNKFVHSPSTGSTIRVDDLDDGYWEKRFTGARRVETSFTPDQQQSLKQRVSAQFDTTGGN
ncbi:cell wall-associated NlpC family hydrolase [Paraburkholderia eburnea]|uniref:Cell wall-associated NlpC family hydrolase n=1 Tax=Paraburkholderia eburnea TaxID=1189126 RepID=A0A2S4MGH2_9BURK|nr:C40 family peptidase [Paraburkholderia eburnea]POR53725.1 cell wall-associated NlpC family hydrolase [Paraburkholderia eburnea]PRZ25693.1 cell wall-associated NlpC family hydrolase [Paraburkholderia eburnea]